MRTRKEMKKSARWSVKEHYGILVVLCLIAAIIGTEFETTLSITGQKKEIEYAESQGEVEIKTNSSITERFGEVMAEIALGNEEEAKREADENIANEVEKSQENMGAVIGRSRGVFSSIVNNLTSGSAFISMAVAISSVVGSKSIAVGVMVIGGLLLYLFVYIFIISTYSVVMRRMFLEGKCYDVLYTNRVFFLLKVKKWCRAGWAVFVKSIYHGLWALTIVGGVVKHYSYYMVPYIIAENPTIGANKAVTLSRRMMNGHKWECFVLDMSFMGWTVLGWLTLGLSNLFFANPYKIATVTEYYAELRRIAKENGIENAELLNDTYLFEKPSEELLHKAYEDVCEVDESKLTKWGELTGRRKFFASVFGITLGNGPEEKAFEEHQSKRIRLFYDRASYEGHTYPTRLSAFTEQSKRSWVAGLNYTRCYSIWSVVMMFFFMSFVGWLWEVSLHLITDGEFVNRGVLHGPWLPIYGTGSVLILIALNKFRRNPGLEFISAVVLCGCVEYFTSYFLEIIHDGTKWWDYSGYFLNLHGRICAEGLLVFGLGGMAIVYLLAPVLDSVFRRIPYKALMAAGIVLLLLFAADEVYSAKYPNEGKGITDYARTDENIEYYSAETA